MSGISLSIIFQYYREKPLWIPIRWNALFLLINLTMVLLLLKESNDAENIPEEQKEIFKTVFESHGMKAIDFLHLMSHAHRHEVKRGEKLVSLGAKHHHLHFVQSGRLSVQRPGETMPEIHEHQFVGAMSFMTWEGNLAAHQRVRHAKIEHFNHWNSDSHFNFTFPSLIGGSESSSAAEKPSILNNEKGLPVNTKTISSSSSSTTVLSTDVSGSRGISLVINGGEVEVREEEEEEEEEEEVIEEAGLADVTCEVDCVVYSWEFRELRELLISSPNLGLVFERCISADLNLKMSTNWSRDHLRRYEQLVRWTLETGSGQPVLATKDQTNVQSLAGASITEKDRLLLSLYRAEYAVTDKEHEQVLHELGWTTEEFLKGKK